jgi:competence protein ComEA
MKRFILILSIFVVSLFAKIDINTATMEQLHSLKGMGDSKAQAIIEYRRQHSFTKIEDIMKVKGIGKKLFEKIKNEIEVNKKINKKG